jgi:hypothetical protein
MKTQSYDDKMDAYQCSEDSFCRRAGQFEGFNFEIEFGISDLEEFLVEINESTPVTAIGLNVKESRGLDVCSNDSLDITADVVHDDSERTEMDALLSLAFESYP